MLLSDCSLTGTMLLRHFTTSSPTQDKTKDRCHSPPSGERGPMIKRSDRAFIFFTVLAGQGHSGSALRPRSMEVKCLGANNQTFLEIQNVNYHRWTFLNSISAHFYF